MKKKPRFERSRRLYRPEGQSCPTLRAGGVPAAGDLRALVDRFMDRSLEISYPIAVVPEPSRERSLLAKRLNLVLRFVVPVAVFAYLLSSIPLSELRASLLLISPEAVLVGMLAATMAVVVSAVRWRLLFAACGISTTVSTSELFRLHLIGNFYNNYLPGGVGGDVVRAIATKPLVGTGGFPLALAIVLLERALGLCGLLVLVVTGFSVISFDAIPNLRLFSFLGIGVAVFAILGIVFGRRVAPFLPAVLRRLANALPSIESVPHFLVALLLSVVTQSSVIVVGHSLIHSLDPNIVFGDSFVVMPLIGASQYFPLTVGGAGVREAAFVIFYGLVGVVKAHALAASLVYALVTYAIAGVGGVLHALRPLTKAT